MNDYLEELIEGLDNLSIIDEPYEIRVNEEERKPNINDPMGASTSASHRKNPHIARSFGKNNYYNSNEEPRYYNPYKPKGNELNPIFTGGVQLDLDCRLEPDKVLINWGRNMDYFMMFNADDEWTSEIKYKYLIGSFTGIVAKWWEGIGDGVKTALEIRIRLKLNENNKEGIIELMNIISLEFLGINWLEKPQESRMKEEEDARTKIYNITICNMKYLREYICNFSDLYYSQYDSDKNQNQMLDMFYSKLPTPWNDYFIKEYKKEEPNPNTLGKRIQFLLTRLREICEQRRLLKRSRDTSNIYCPTIEIGGNWGCKTNQKRRKRSYKTNEKSRYYKRHKNFQKKNDYKPYKKYAKRYNKKPKKNLKECKCWECGEIGHIKPDCPKIRNKPTYKIEKTYLESDLETIEYNDISEEESSVYEISLTETEESENEH